MEIDQDSSSVQVERSSSASDRVVPDLSLTSLTSSTFYPPSLSQPLPGTSNMDFLARPIHPFSSKQTESLPDQPQHGDSQSICSQMGPSISRDLPLATSASLSSATGPAHISLQDVQIDSYHPPSRSTADVFRQHPENIGSSFQQQTYQNIYHPSSLFHSSSSSLEQTGSDLHSRGHFSTYTSQLVNPADCRGETLSAADRVKLLGRQQTEGVLDTEKESVDRSTQVGVEEDNDEELEPADSDVDMDSTENTQESEKKKKKWNKAPQSGKNWRSGLKRAPDGSWEVPPDSANSKTNQSFQPLHSLNSVPPTLTDSVLTAEPMTTSTSNSNLKKAKPKAKPKTAQNTGTSNETDATLSSKKKASRKKKQSVGANPQGPTRSPSPAAGLPNDQPTPTASSSRARSYSQSVDPEGAMEEEGYVETSGRKSAKRRKIEEREKEKEREREIEELLRRQRDEEDEESEDDQLYCVCDSRYDADSPMIACDMCAEWYHPKCVEIPEEEIELVDQFICPKCHEETAEKTTWRTKCRSVECFKPAVPPLTKYCSTACGTAHLTTVLENKDIDLSRHWNQVERAQRPSGVVIVNPDFPSRRSSASTSKTTSDISIEPSKSPAPTTVESAELSSLDLSDHPATRHLHLTDTNLRTSIDKVQTQLSLLSNRLTLLSFASNRTDSMPSVASLSLKEDPVVSPERPTSGSKRGPPKKKTASGGGAGGSGLGDRPCGFDQRLILDEQEFGQFCDSEEGRALFTQPLENELGDSSVKKEGGKETEDEGKGNQSSAHPGFETYLRAGEKDLERKQKSISDTDMQVDGHMGLGGHQAGSAEMEDTWCYRSKKKCEGHRGWQKIRLIDFQLEQSSKRNTLGLLERTRLILQQDIQVAEKRIRRAMEKTEMKHETKAKIEAEAETVLVIPNQSINNKELKEDRVIAPSVAITATNSTPTTAGATIATEAIQGVATKNATDVTSNPPSRIDLPTKS